ncbi:MAG: LptF/LptG family permease [Elusimicrobiota bacterium]
MTTLSRYLVRSYIPPFLLSLGIFLFVLLMNHFLRLFNLAVMKGISLAWIFFCFSRLMPFFLSMALPMAFLVALLLTLGQLSESGEVLALRSSGFSFRAILAPYFAIALLLSVFLFLINHKVSPEGFHSFRDSYARAVSQVPHLELDPRTLTRMGEWEIYAEKVVPGTGLLGGVRLVKRQGKYARLRISAPQGTARLERGRGLRLELRDGILLWPNNDPESRTSSTFGRYHMFMPFATKKEVREPDMQELNSLRMRALLDDDKLQPQKRREYLTEIAVRSAAAAAPFVLFWVACPLGLGLERRSRAVGFALSLVVMFSYYGLLALGIGLGRRDVGWASWAPWLPNAASLVCGGALWWRCLRR